jgi:hypothetical protein
MTKERKVDEREDKADARHAPRLGCRRGHTPHSEDKLSAAYTSARPATPPTPRPGGCALYAMRLGGGGDAVCEDCQLCGTYEHPNWLLRSVGLCSGASSAPQTARAARPRHRMRSHHPRAHATSAAPTTSVAYCASVIPAAPPAT